MRTARLSPRASVPGRYPLVWSSAGQGGWVAGLVLLELGDRTGAMRAWRLVVERDGLLAPAAEGRMAVARGER